MKKRLFSALRVAYNIFEYLYKYNEMLGYYRWKDSIIKLKIQLFVFLCLYNILDILKAMSTFYFYTVFVNERVFVSDSFLI